jgi:hypothetical protein
MCTFFHTQVCRGESRISCNSLHLNTFVSKTFDNLELMKEWVSLDKSVKCKRTRWQTVLESKTTHLEGYFLNPRETSMK